VELPCERSLRSSYETQEKRTGNAKLLTKTSVNEVNPDEIVMPLVAARARCVAARFTRPKSGWF
jgi:hypothetical protein